MDSPLVGSPVHSSVFAFDNTDEFRDESSPSLFSGKTVQPACSDQVLSLKELALHSVTDTLHNEPEKIVAARVSGKLNRKDIHYWLLSGGDEACSFTESLPAGLTQEIVDVYRIRSGKNAEELMGELKKWEQYCNDSDESRGFETIGFIGGGSNFFWVISRQLNQPGKGAVSFPFCLADFDKGIHHEQYYFPLTTNPPHTQETPTSSLSSYSTGSYFSATSEIYFSLTPDTENGATASAQSHRITPRWCTDKANVFLHKIGQYNATDTNRYKYDGIVNFAVLGDKKQPLVIVIQSTYREESPDVYYDTSPYYYPLVGDYAQLTKRILDECAHVENLTHALRVVMDWVTSDSCPEEDFTNCYGPCVPSKRADLPLLTEATEAIPIPARGARRI